MIKPEPGRIVHVHFSEDWKNQTIAVRDRRQPLAGQIAYVWHDRMVSLSVIDQNGTQHPLTSCRLLQDDDKPAGESYWCEWMPYQKQVASGERAPVQHATPK